MTLIQRIQDFVSRKRLAIVGISRQPKDFSRMLLREFRDRGYDIAPVNPEAAEIDGLPCFSRVQDIHPPVEGVLVMTPASAAEAVVRDCAAAGVPRVWLYRAAGQGAVTPEAVSYCLANGISVIPGECPLMFLPRARWFHRAHGLVNRIRGTYPR
jgi:predicted CoA-binding protein